MIEPKDSYGRTGALTVRQIALAVVSAFPTAATSEDLAAKRLTAVLAAAATDQGLIEISEKDAFAAAGLASNRDARKAWQSLLKTHTKPACDKSGDVRVLDPEALFPVVLTGADNSVVVMERASSVLSQSDLEDVDGWIVAVCDDLVDRGLAYWQRLAVAVELSRTAVATVDALEPDSVGRRHTDVVCAFDALTLEIDAARVRARKNARKQKSLAETEAALRSEIVRMEQDLQDLGDRQAGVDEAVRLAHEVLQAAALLEQS